MVTTKRFIMQRFFNRMTLIYEFFSVHYVIFIHYFDSKAETAGAVIGVLL